MPRFHIARHGPTGIPACLQKYIFPYPKPSAAKPPHPRNIRLPRIPVMHNKTHRNIQTIPLLQRISLAPQRIHRQRPPIRHEPGKTLRARIRKQRPARLPAATVPEQSTQSETSPLIAPPPTRPSESTIVAPFVTRSVGPY